MLLSLQQGQFGRRRVGAGGGGGATYSAWDVSSLPANVTASESNFRLTRSGGSNGVRGVYHSISRSTGKYALRFLVKNVSAQAPACGILSGAIGSFLGGTGGTSIGLWGNSSGTSDLVYSGGSQSFGDAASFTTDTEVMFEVDLDADKVWVGIAGAWFAGVNPSGGTGQTVTLTTGISIRPTADMYYPGEVKLMVPADFITPATSGFTAGWPD